MHLNCSKKVYTYPVNQLVRPFGVWNCWLSCKFWYFVASHTFIANGLDCRHCTIGRLNLIHREFSFPHLKQSAWFCRSRKNQVNMSRFSWGLVKSWSARISQWSEDCWTIHYEGTKYLQPKERRQQKNREERQGCIFPIICRKTY